MYVLYFKNIWYKKNIQCVFILSKILILSRVAFAVR